MADIKDLNSYTFSSGQKLVDIEHDKYDLYFTRGYSSIETVKKYSTEEEGKHLEETYKNVEKNYKEYKKLSTPENKEKLFKSFIDYDVYERFLVDNHIKPNWKEIIKENNRRVANGETIYPSDDSGQIYNVNVINYPKGYDDWLERKNKELEKQIQQQLLKEQVKEDVHTTIALNSMTNDIVIEPYSRKPEDIESMKVFVAKVSGESIENITNQQSQAFIDNLGTPYEDYLTLKTDGTFEHTHNSAYSSEISKTTEPKKILSIIDDFANDHQAGRSEGSEQSQDYEYIHSLNERLNEINKKDLIKNTNDKAEELRNALKSVLNEKVHSLETIPFTRENYNKLFPESKIITPLEVVKLGEHQFEKLDIKERQNILNAVHETLETPDIVINEMRKTVFDDERPAHIYAKSFEINGKNKAIQSVVVDIESENVSISTHERGINNVVNKIKMPEQLIYTSEEIGQMIERITGKQYSTVNPTRVNNEFVSPNMNISQSKEKSNSVINKLENELLEKNKELDIWTSKAESDNKEISRLNNQLEAANNTIQKLEKQNKEQDELLNGKGSVKVNGVERKFEHGLKQAFPEAVKRIDIENQRNKELTADYNKLLKSHNQNISPKSPGDDSSWSN